MGMFSAVRAALVRDMSRPPEGFGGRTDPSASGDFLNWKKLSHACRNGLGDRADSFSGHDGARPMGGLLDPF